MEIRNIAIIAHVDHGKTTLVDGMLKQTHTFRQNQEEMRQTTILDSNDLEREKGITILAKNTAVRYKDVKINVIDTPGHADFSGEVERVINMADGALLVIDAAEGPLPQTEFVLQKSLEQHLKLIVVINKIDRKDARPQEVLTETEELFLRLARHEDHLSFPVIYAIGRAGKAWSALPEDVNEPADLTPIFEEIVKTIPAPDSDARRPFKLLVSTLDFDPYKGVYAIGKISQGIVKEGQSVMQMFENRKIGMQKVEQVFTSKGLERVEVPEGAAGDIVALTGIDGVAIGQTLTDPVDPVGFPAMKLGEPTLTIQIGANTSPFSGKEGSFCTVRQLEERLMKEKKTNIGLRVEPNPDGTGFMVAGRGELHLSILIENLRRDGYEMHVGRPQVILKETNAIVEEPYEEVTIEIDQSSVGTIVEEMGRRKGELVDTVTNDQGLTRMVYKISERNLLGFRSGILTKTRGKGLFATRLLGYFPQGPLVQRSRNGVLIAHQNGVATAHALEAMQNRGTAFIGPGTKVYEGMIVGLNKRPEDIDINVCKAKNLTNVHTELAEVNVRLAPPVVMTLEQSLDFLEDDELLEVTPLSLRLRKRMLTKLSRVRAQRESER